MPKNKRPEKSTALHSLLAIYSEIGKVVSARDCILAPSAISMRIAIDLVVWRTTAP